jgi:hypothetical protein
VIAWEGKVPGNKGQWWQPAAAAPLFFFNRCAATRKAGSLLHHMALTWTDARFFVRNSGTGHMSLSAGRLWSHRFCLRVQYNGAHCQTTLPLPVTRWEILVDEITAWEDLVDEIHKPRTCIHQNVCAVSPHCLSGSSVRSLVCFWHVLLILISLLRVFD